MDSSTGTARDKVGLKRKARSEFLAKVKDQDREVWREVVLQQSNLPSTATAAQKERLLERSEKQMAKQKDHEMLASNHKYCASSDEARESTECKELKKATRESSDEEDKLVVTTAILEAYASNRELDESSLSERLEEAGVKVDPGIKTDVDALQEAVKRTELVTAASDVLLTSEERTELATAVVGEEKQSEAQRSAFFKSVRLTLCGQVSSAEEITAERVKEELEIWILPDISLEKAVENILFELKTLGCDAAGAVDIQQTSCFDADWKKASDANFCPAVSLTDAAVESLKSVGFVCSALDTCTFVTGMEGATKNAIQGSVRCCPISTEKISPQDMGAQINEICPTLKDATISEETGPEIALKCAIKLALARVETPNVRRGRLLQEAQVKTTHTYSSSGKTPETAEAEILAAAQPNQSEKESKGGEELATDADTDESGENTRLQSAGVASGPALVAQFALVFALAAQI